MFIDMSMREIGRDQEYVGDGVSKALTNTEIEIIFDKGLRFFPIYQKSGRSSSYFSPLQGAIDAVNAINAANSLRIPYQSIIYFAVDFDTMDYQIIDNILPYFQSIKSNFDEFGRYQIGIYGARNVCRRVSTVGYSISSFVGDMSTGFSGNLD